MKIETTVEPRFSGPQNSGQPRFSGQTGADRIFYLINAFKIVDKCKFLKFQHPALVDKMFDIMEKNRDFLTFLSEKSHFLVEKRHFWQFFVL